MCIKYILMAIKPKYASQIKDGRKIIELRRVAPKVSRGDILVIYESAPISRITAYGEIDSVLTMEPNSLWEAIGNQTMVDKDTFDNYFEGKDYANGIKVKNIISLKQPKNLKVILKDRAPQNYYYITKEEFYKIK